MDHPLPALLKEGMDPAEVGRWVVRAIEDDMFYIFTHPAWKAPFHARADDILAAYDTAAERRS